MTLSHPRSFMNLRSAFVSRKSCLGSRRRAWRIVPYLVPLESRALLSTITVTNSGDSGMGSLRQALASAVSGDTIQFAHSAFGTISLTSGPLVVATNVAINGPGASKLAINGNNTFQDLLVNANVTAKVSGLTITGGEGPTGSRYGGAGGILNDGTLTVDQCVITKNTAPGSDQGGGIFNLGSLTITNSVVSNNSAGVGGGIGTTGTLVVKNSTINANSATYGGGINSFYGQLTLTNCVVSGNVGGGISGGQAPMSLTNCTVSNNSPYIPGGGFGYGVNCFAADLNLVNCVVSGNTAGGVSISGFSYGPPATLTVIGSSVVNNSISRDSYSAVGAGIVSRTANVTVTGSLIANNKVTAPLALGGGIAMETGFSRERGECLDNQQQHAREQPGHRYRYLWPRLRRCDSHGSLRDNFGNEQLVPEQQRDQHVRGAGRRDGFRRDYHG